MIQPIVSEPGLLAAIIPLVELLLEERASTFGTSREAQLPFLLRELANRA